MQYILKKEEFPDFFSEVRKEFAFIAPVAGDPAKKVQRTQFQEIEDSADIHIDINTYFPAKYFFFDKAEELFAFEGNKVKDPSLDIAQRVIFGLRRCDLVGIKHQDMVFLDEQPDPFYKARRDATLLCGLHCKGGDEYCFCQSFDHEDIYDLMCYDKDDIYVIETGSEKGEEFAKAHLQETEDILTDEDRVTQNIFKLDTTEIKDHFQDEGWKELADTCLSCGACNHLCPNCHCFTIKDDVNMDLKTGRRIRNPASCQLRSFTRVAGDHVFRDARVERYKHRIYHQIEYFRDRHGEEFCTGCGRCIRGCPVRIDWVTKINQMIQ